MTAVVITIVLLVGASWGPATALVGLEPEALFFAPLLTALCATVAGLLALVFRTPLLPWMLIVLIVLHVLALRREGELAARHHGWGWLAPLVVFGAAFLPIVVLQTPDVGWDGRSIWMLHARWFYAGGSYLHAALGNRAYLFSHPDYPPLIPATAGALMRVKGVVDLRVGQVTVTTLNVSAVGLIGLGFLRVAPRRHAAPSAIVGAAVCLAAYGLAGSYITNGYADLLWAAAAAGGLMFLLILPIAPEHLAVGLLLTAVAGLTKNEGLPVAVLILALTAVRHRRRLQPLVPALVGVVVLLAVWPALAGLAGAHSDLLGGALPSGAPKATGPGGWARLAPTLRGVKAWCLGPGRAALACSLGGLVVLRRARRRLGLGSTFLTWTVILGSLAALVAAYVASPYDLGWHLGTSLDQTTIAPRLFMLTEVGCWVLCGAATIWPPAIVIETEPPPAEPEVELAGVAGPGIMARVVRWRVPSRFALARTRLHHAERQTGTRRFASWGARKVAHDGLWTPQAVLLAMIGVYVVVFGSLTWSQQSNFGTFGFDMGIYDQGVYLLSRFQINPFDTVRGLPFFAHHVNFIAFLLVPAYWLGAGPHFLYLFETVALALGALPLWLLARDRIGDGWLALCPAAAYLLFPSLEWINEWHFHPDALIITPLLFAYWLGTRRRWGWFALAVTVALLCKEDAALAIFVLGLVLSWKLRRPWVLLTAVAGAAWWFFATKLVIPTANGGGQVFYENLFPGFGTSFVGIITTIIRHPIRLWRAARQKPQITYYSKLLVPVGLLPLGSLLILAIAGPQLVVNVISGHPYTHDIRYHYSSIVIAGIFLATVETIGRPGRKSSDRRFLCGLLMATALASNVAWSPSPLSVQYHSGIWAKANAADVAKNAAVALVPHGAATTATYYLVPHLTHRQRIYEFPNPWVVSDWGVHGERPPDPAKVDWLVLDTSLNGSQEPLYQKLVAYQFRVVYANGTIVVAQRIHPAGTGPPLS